MTSEKALPERIQHKTLIKFPKFLKTKQVLSKRTNNSCSLKLIREGYLSLRRRTMSSDHKQTPVKTSQLTTLTKKMLIKTANTPLKNLKKGGAKIAYLLLQFYRIPMKILESYPIKPNFIWGKITWIRFWHLQIKQRNLNLRSKSSTSNGIASSPTRKIITNTLKVIRIQTMGCQRIKMSKLFLIKMRMLIRKHARKDLIQLNKNELILLN